MGSEVSSGLILFIAAIAVAGVAAAGMAKVVGSMAHELGERGEVMSQAIGTDVALINDPDNVPYDSGAEELTLYVKNTGSQTLMVEELSVLVNGQHRTFTSQLLDGATRWSQGTVLELTVSVALASGDHKARVIYTPNIADNIEFRV